MKNSGSKPQTGAFSSKQKNQRPDVRDDLDSRKNEEQETKGDDVTHNEKKVQSENKETGGKHNT